MSGMSNLMTDLQDELEQGFLTFDQIAAKYEVPESWVQEAAEQLVARLVADVTMDG